jgi:hypothetical protein
MQAFGSRKPGLATLKSRPPRLCGSIDNGPERRTPFQRMHPADCWFGDRSAKLWPVPL